MANHAPPDSPPGARPSSWKPRPRSCSAFTSWVALRTRPSRARSRARRAVQLLAHEEGRRSRRAVVVDVVDGDAGQAESVDYGPPVAHGSGCVSDPFDFSG